MKIQRIQLPRLVKNVLITAPLLMATQTAKSQQLETPKDVFVKSEIEAPIEVPDSMLMSPELNVAGKDIYPALVVDISEGRLYHYDNDTHLKEVYPITSGKKSTPTKPALKIINGIEEYPYKAAPKATKRYKKPNDYGTHLLNLSIIDPKTGNVIGNDGQFIHGTFKPSSIGKKVSKGCVRVHNEVIDTLASTLKAGQYVLIKE